MNKSQLMTEMFPYWMASMSLILFTHVTYISEDQTIRHFFYVKGSVPDMTTSIKLRTISKHDRNKCE